MSILSVKNLEKKFGDLTVLKDISFNINDGRSFRSLDHQDQENQHYCVV